MIPAGGGSPETSPTGINAIWQLLYNITARTTINPKAMAKNNGDIE